MSRLCVPGLLALLAAAPLTVRADDKADAEARAKAAEQAAADAAAKLKQITEEAMAAAKAAAPQAKPAADKPATAPAPAAEPEKKPDAPAAEKPADKPAADKPAADPKAEAEAKADTIRKAAIKIAPMLRLNLGNAIRMKVAAGAAAPAAQDDEDEDNNDPTKPAKLSDEDKKALEEFVQKAAKSKRKQFEEFLKTDIESVVKNLKLDRDTEKKLTAQSGKAVDAAMPDWEKAFSKWVQSMLPRNGGIARALSSWSADGYARNTTSFSGFSAPSDTEAWKTVLKETLTPEQLTAHTEAVKAAEKKFQEDFGDYLATGEGQAGDQMSAAMEAELNRIAQFSGLDEDRQKKLKAAGDEAVKQCVKDWRAQTERQLKAMDQKSREQMTNRGGMVSLNMTDKTYQPKERAVWKDAMGLLLQDQERQTLELRYQEVRGRRADALSILLVTDLDKLVGFSTDQRKQFLPLASKRLLKLPDHYFTNPENGGYYSIDMGQMLTLVQKIKDDELKPFLSETQLKRFRSTSADQLSRSNVYTRDKLDLGEMPKPEEMDEVEVERIVSRYLHREAKKAKLKMFSTMEAKVEHVTRVTSPSPETIGTLTTAAKGAAEELAQGSINNASSWLRSNVQGVKPADVPARLEALYTPYYSYSERNQPAVPAIWNSTVQRLLNDDQRKLWKAETDLREVWRREGLTAMVVTEVEKRLVLSEEQRAKLSAKMDTVIKQYEPDFASYFSFGWHLQGYYALIPIALLSEKEMEEHFDKKQIGILKGRTLSNATQYAEMIRNNHASRIRRQ